MGEMEGLIWYYVVWIASFALTKTLEREGSILSSRFCGQLADYYSHVYSLIRPIDEFSFK